MQETQWSVNHDFPKDIYIKKKQIKTSLNKESKRQDLSLSKTKPPPNPNPPQTDKTHAKKKTHL